MHVSRSLLFTGRFEHCDLRKRAIESPASDSNGGAHALSVPCLLLELGRGCIPPEEEAYVILLSSIEIGSDFGSFCRSISSRTEINYVNGDWLRK